MVADRGRCVGGGWVDWRMYLERSVKVCLLAMAM